MRMGVALSIDTFPSHYVPGVEMGQVAGGEEGGGKFRVAVVEVDDTVVCRCCPGLEMVGDSKRTLAGSVYQMFWPVGVFVLTGVAYLLRDWSHLQLAIACPAVLFLSYGL